MKISRETLFAVALVCSFFSVAALPVNPVYLLVSFLFCLTFCFFLLRMKLHNVIVKEGVFFALFGFNTCLALYNQFYNTELAWFRLNDHVSVSSSLLFLLCFLLGSVAFSATYYSDTLKRKLIYKKIVSYLIFFLFFELISRLILGKPEAGIIYGFKHGPFFFDSNFLGITLALILCFYQFLSKYGLAKLNRIESLALHFFLICSFSRAAILGYCISRVVLSQFKYIKYSSLLLVMGGGLVAGAMLTLYQGGESFQNIDGSFNSKFYIIDRALSLYQSLPVGVKITGLGLNNLEGYIGIFAHNIFITCLLEFGLFGSIVFVAYICFLIHKSCWAAMYIVLPLIIIGFSLFGAYSPHFFVLANVVVAEVLLKSKSESMFIQQTKEKNVEYGNASI